MHAPARRLPDDPGYAAYSPLMLPDTADTPE
jgi:hypothetical protein